MKKYPCNKCEKTYVWKESLRQHQHREHGILPFSKLYECSFCDFVSNNMDNVKRHMRIKYLENHPQQPKDNYECDTCGNTYAHKCTLKRHKKYACSQETFFVCDYCGHKEYLKTNIRKHIIRKHLS